MTDSAHLVLVLDVPPGAGGPSNKLPLNLDVLVGVLRLGVSGFVAGAMGSGHAVRNQHETLYVTGFDNGGFGRPHAFNLVWDSAFVGLSLSGAIAGDAAHSPLHLGADLPPGLVGVSGTNFCVFGTAQLIQSSFIVPIGVAGFQGFGTAQLTQNLVVAPSGVVTSVFGIALVANRNRYVITYSLDAFQGFGPLVWVSLSRRRIYPGLGSQTLWGSAQLAGGIRWLDLAGRSILPGPFGNTTIDFKNRQIFPSWFVTALYGVPMVDYDHPVDVSGIDAGAFGVAEAHRPRLSIDLYGLGVRGSLWGDSSVDNYTQHVSPAGFLAVPTEAERFGRGEVYLWVRYVVQMYDESPFEGGVFGDYNYVYNHIQVPQAEGIRSERYGTPEVYNNARLIDTLAYQDFSTFGDPLVAYRIRTLLMQGSDTSVFGAMLGPFVWNVSRVLAPAGWGSSACGTPGPVWSNQQTIHWMSGLDMALIDPPMVAFRIRTIAQYRLPNPPPFGDADLVQNWVRTLAPPGCGVGLEPFHASGFGSPTLEIHFTVFAPRPILPLPNQVSDSAYVWNLTPTLYEMGAEQTDWGRPQLHNQWEAYTFEGFCNLVFGAPVVRDRRSWIVPSGVPSRPVSALLEVRNVIPDPPGSQTLGVSGFSSLLMGDGPLVRSNVLWLLGDTFVRFGMTVLVYMGFSPISILPPLDATTGSQFGVPSLPGAQTVVHHQEVEAVGYSLPDVGPRYVWAPRGYPYLSPPSYWHDEGHIMDYVVHQYDESRPVFGYAAVTLQNRVLVHRHDLNDDFGVFTAYGTLRISTNPQYLRMGGTRLQRFGIPVLGGGDFGALFYGLDQAEYGTPSVAFVPLVGTQTIHLVGWHSGVFGTASIDLFNRQLHPQGWIGFEISPPAPPSWPRVSTWVSNEYAPFPVVGFDASAFGTTWVSYYIRTFEMQGWDSEIVADYEMGYFVDHMRVRRNDILRNVSLGAVGVLGQPWVSFAQRNLLEWIFYTGRVGNPSVRMVSLVQPAGIDAGAFGDVQRWEAGKIKPYGDDLAALGRAVISRVLHPDSFVGAVGTPRMCSAITPMGINEVVVPVPTMIAWVCDVRARAIPGFAAGAMGTPYIAYGVGSVVAQGFDASLFGTSILLQVLYVSGVTAGDVGAVTVAPGIVLIHPDGIAAGAEGSPSLARTLLMAGADVGAIGAAVVAAWGHVYADGWQEDSFGESTVTSLATLVCAGDDEEVFGEMVIRDSRTIVSKGFVATSGFDRIVVYHKDGNGAKTFVYPVGTDMSRLGGNPYPDLDSYGGTHLRVHFPDIVSGSP